MFCLIILFKYWTNIYKKLYTVQEKSKKSEQKN